ncbi:histidine protein methyltransferase 1 homolog [Cynara cardunculus var. scolymus]|uniref:protein-histidine N-methyltransferase n=1 Tax=Cynara cardunculus var. scolymus TaxID=59895 RepID=A0A103YFV8_CYNCS|nr:histidine protein methyltransferase 1 homolog [Cynara cardunculus var. scolymus]KVI08349.1 Nicotinamide N-methyltransferase-like protein [Cynara cardunculus var. scolymus]
MAANQSGVDSFQLFPSANDNKAQLGFSFLDDSPEKPPIPLPPPCLEVLLSQVSSSVKPTLEPVNLDGLTLLKGRVSTHEVFALSNSDLVPGKYEGGLKLWEGSLDLVKSLQSEVESGNLSLIGKKVLEIGCGHGLPGIFSCLQGASAVHFQDFNSEVLQCLTIPNVVANIPVKSQSLAADAKSWDTDAEVRFFAGDWSEVHQILPNLQTDDLDSNCSPGSTVSVGYDIILMAETVYSISALPALYELIKKCMSHPHGVVYMAAKKYYFGVGGGSRRFVSLVEKDGVMVASLIAEVGGGSSNVREVWKLQFK